MKAFALSLIFILCSGCHTTKWRWFPEEDNLSRRNDIASPFTKVEEEPSSTIDVLKVSF